MKSNSHLHGIDPELQHSFAHMIKPIRNTGGRLRRLAWLLLWSCSIFLTPSPTRAQYSPLALSGGPVVRMVADFQQPYLYAIESPAPGAANGTLLFIDATSGGLVNSVSMGTNLTDLAINEAERMLYVLDHGNNTVGQVDLASRTWRSTFSYSTSLSTVSGLDAGRFLAGGQGIYYICSAGTGIPISTNWIAFDGDGAVDASGSFFFLGSVGGWPPDILRWQIQGEYLAAGAPALVQQIQNVNGYGSYHLLLSHDNSRLFYNGNVYDTNLDHLAWLGAEVFACSSNGALAFTSSQVFDGNTWQLMNNLSVTSSVTVVDGLDQRFWYCNSLSNTIESVPLGSVQAPNVWQAPTNQTVFSGTTATLDVAAGGKQPLTYFWLFNGNCLAVTTNAQLALPNIHSPDVGSYSVTVSNAYGWVTSSSAMLNLTNSPPILGAQAGSQTYLAGTNAALVLVALGSLPMSYQWQYNGTNLPSATNSTLLLTNLQVNQSGSYSVLVSNPFGTAVSSNALVSVIPFAVTAQPQSQSVQEMMRVAFNTAASGLAPLTYQWQLQGTNLLQATNSSLVISNVLRSQAGVYSVVISNQYGVNPSSNANLTVNSLTSWGSGGASLNNLPAKATNLIALAAGDEHCLALRADGTVVAWGDDTLGQTNVPADLTNVVSIAAGSTHGLALRNDGTLAMWGVIETSGVTNAPANATNIAALALGPGAQHALMLRSDGSALDWGNSLYGASLTNIPLMAQNLVDVAAGAFYALALRSDGRVVQWGTNEFGSSLPSVPTGATNIVALATGWNGNAGLRSDGTVLVWGSVYTPPPTFTNILDLACPRNALFGNCDVLALRRNGTLTEYLNAVSAYATNNISMIAAGSYNGFAAVGDGPPAFSRLPLPRTVAAGSRAYFRAVAAGAMPIRYQWSCNGTNIPGATNTVLVLSNVQPAQAGCHYTLTATNGLGEATSGAMSLSVIPGEVYVSYSNSVAVASGTTTFTATTIGAGPFGYQWSFDGTNLIGATNSSLLLTNLQMEQAGLYSVAASNAFGIATSAGQPLSVIPLAITAQPQSQSSFRWSTANFSVTAGGVAPLSYQWLYGGAELPGETNATLSLFNVQPQQAGSYSVRVSNGWATIVSSSAWLTVPSLVFWGDDSTGQGVLPASTSNVLAIAAGAYHALALRPDGTVVAWGLNSSGQASVPAQLTNVIAIEAGYNHSAVLAADGSVVGWGTSYLTPPATLTNLVAVHGIISLLLGLEADGTVFAWGSTPYGTLTVPPAVSNVTAVAAGYNHCVALQANGNVIAWGYDAFNQTDTPPDLTNAVAVAAGNNHTLAIREGGSVVAWGYNSSGQTNVPPDLTNAVAVAGGWSHSLALRADGTVVAWGDNSYGQTNIPAGLTNVVAIAAGAYFNLALIGDAPPASTTPVNCWTSNRNAVNISFSARSGNVYTLEYQSGLGDPTWTILQMAPGNGTILNLSDPDLSEPARFYRVRRW